MSDEDLYIPREALRNSLWSVIGLANLVVINAARRLGKTTLMKSMAAMPPDGHAAYWIDLQHTSDVAGFADVVSSTTSSKLSKSRRLGLLWRQNVGYLSSFELGPIKLPEIQGSTWKSLVRYNLEALSKSSNKCVVVFFDEIPLFLHKLISAGEASTAAEVLNLLRGIAESESPRIRFVYAGSLGLHHVLDKIQDSIKENPPMVNDAHIFPLPTLSSKEGGEVGANLLERHPIKYSAEAMEEISRLCDGIPFYIRQITLSLMVAGEDIDEELVQETVEATIRDPNDLLHIEKDHFLRLRNEDYYHPAKHDLVHTMLSLIAEENGNPIKIPKLVATLSKEYPEIKDLENLLSTLQQDHLLEREGDEVGFKFSIVRRTWKYHKMVGGESD